MICKGLEKNIFRKTCFQEKTSIHEKNTILPNPDAEGHNSENFYQIYGAKNKERYPEDSRTAFSGKSFIVPKNTEDPLSLRNAFTKPKTFQKVKWGNSLTG